MRPIFSALVSLALTLFLAGCSTEDTPLGPPASPGGTLIIHTIPDSLLAQWTCTPPEGRVISGRGDTTLVDMPVGHYTVAWEGLFGWTTPAADTKYLFADSTLVVTGVYGPGQPPPPTPESWLFDVGGTAADDVYAVGNLGALIHFDGTSWSRVDLGVTSTLVALARTEAGDMWACGNQGRVYHQNGLVWSAVDFGSDADLYAVGAYAGVLHAGGQGGVLRRYLGGVWQPVGESAITRDPVTDAPLDTFQLSRDLTAITTIGHFGIGGAYQLPGYQGDPIGIQGTQGMVLGEDPAFDWRLDPLDTRGTDTAEWVLCSTSDASDPQRNYLGTATGGLFRLQDDGTGTLRWQRQAVAITDGPEAGIRDLWLDPVGNLYLVTDEGQVVYLPEGGDPQVIFDGSTPLAGVWGTDPGNLWVVGLMDHQVLHLAHDPEGATAVPTLWDVSELPISP